ncbi:cobalamin-independent methionine synthase II family protein [Sphingobacterium chuzhouense]|uniref:Cobalamin-independent methionine synthase II family protein n=1 Tax=Sphingobacterium chuzhouense TaxID=1742264 RepID=A0ABR7XUY7_9SPHI|nr:cobalamin-independent methionine synthase II family protein [Sphingobacterium chuzhouense]MBD1422862.1 cobalamin-independent methionine synthase II family protein [Sphingobacterium chuzhouense]
MVGFRNTVVGSYPRPEKLEDTMKRPVMTQEEVDDYIKWAAKDQAELGLDTITDGEGYRENMYYFYQKRIDGITFEDMPKVSFGTAGFGIECPRVIGELKNPRFDIARNWKIARDAAPADVEVKLTVTGPHVLYRFSVNEREDLYPDAQALCRAWAHVLRDEIAEAIALGCEHVQFDEPMWTESPEESVWAAEILAELIASLPKKVRIGLHVCGGNPRRKRVYFTKYTDIVDAFKAVPVDELLLEHCTLSYNMLELFDQWDFKGDLAIGVIDQRSDELESVEEIRQRIKPALDYFPADRLILTSECGFGHVPIDVTHAKLKRLVEASKVL